MKLATYSFKADEQKRFGFVHETYMIDILRASAWANKTHNNSNFLHIPSSLKLALENWEVEIKDSINSSTIIQGKELKQHKQTEIEMVLQTELKS